MPTQHHYNNDVLPLTDMDFTMPTQHHYNNDVLSLTDMDFTMPMQHHYNNDVMISINLLPSSVDSPQRIHA